MSNYWLDENEKIAIIAAFNEAWEKPPEIIYRQDLIKQITEHFEKELASFNISSEVAFWVSNKRTWVEIKIIKNGKTITSQICDNFAGSKIKVALD